MGEGTYLCIYLPPNLLLLFDLGKEERDGEEKEGMSGDENAELQHWTDERLLHDGCYQQKLVDHGGQHLQAISAVRI